MGYGLLLIGFLICAIASWNVNATFKRYQSVSNRRGMTAAEAARQILNENGLQFIQIERVSGSLTDHYDPRANVIRLSDSVYDSTSVAAIGVAAMNADMQYNMRSDIPQLKFGKPSFRLRSLARMHGILYWSWG